MLVSDWLSAAAFLDALDVVYGVEPKEDCVLPPVALASMAWPVIVLCGFGPGRGRVVKKQYRIFEVEAL